MKGRESMASKKTNIKIKKSKYNLYNKKKNKSKQALTWALTVFAACVLGVVGYGVGKPIYNYFEAKNNTTSTVSGENSETNSGDVSEPVSNNSEVTSDPTTSDPPEPPGITSKDLKLCVLPPETATSSASLNSALAVAREAGYDTVAVTLKDEQGLLYYSSDIEGVSGTDLIHGTLSAAQICDYITKAGMTPAVKISALKDKSTTKFFGGYTVGEIAWLDDYPEAGGKTWLSPFDEDTVKFIGDLTKELSTAGFRHIICENITYPFFHPVDYDYLSYLPINDRAARLEALWNVADAAKSGADEGNAKLWLEFDGNSLAKEDKYATNAELASDKTKLADFGIIADYSMGKAEEAYSEALEFAKKIKVQTDGDLAALIKNGPSGAALEDIKKAFKEQDIEAFSEN